MKLAEIIQLLSLFGYREEEIRSRLAGGESPHNAWEGLKVELQAHWEDAVRDIGEERLVELREAYEKLQSLTLKSALKQSEVDAAERERFAKVARGFQEQLAGRAQQNLQEFAKELEKAFERQLEQNPDCKRTKDALEKLRRGESPI